MKKLYRVITPTMLLAGCSTMDQVPLIYASTTRIGLSAESGTPQVPGAKAIFGYDSTDLAMVPIAVSRACNIRDSTDCEKYKIDLVSGGNNISPAAYLLATKANADALSDASDAIGQAQQNLVTASRNARDAEAEWASLHIAVPTTATETTPDSETFQMDAKTDEPVTATPDQIAAAKQKLDRMKAAEKEAGETLERAYSRFAKRREDLTEALRNKPDAVGNRTDALSVFGSFNADASAKTDGDANAKTAGAGVGIKLGKSFSTGIAAQLLTEGLKQAAASSSAQACLGQAMAIAKDHPEQLDAAMRICAGR
jgi:hypothetical protein